MGKRYVFLVMSLERAWYKVQRDRASLYKIILPHKPLRLYFDFDGCKPSPTFFKHVSEAVQCASPLNFDTLPRIVLTANSKAKLSYHVIYPTVIFLNLQHLKNFLQQFLPASENLYDAAVYTQYRQFRVLGSSKFGENRPLRVDPLTHLIGQRSVTIEVMFCLTLISNIYI